MAHATIQLPASGVPASPLAGDLLHDPAIAQALAAVRDHLGVAAAFVARYLPGASREVTHVDCQPGHPLVPGRCDSVVDTFCWHVLEGRLPELVSDAGADPLAASLAMTREMPVGCHLSVPLRLPDGEVWGSFAALGSAPDSTLGARDLQVLRAFASLVAQRIAAATAAQREDEEARARVTDMLDGAAITIFHQPIHALDTGEPVGVECLARFPRTRQRGPDAWFEDAQRVGLGVELEMAAVRAALETLSHVPQGKYASVNVSPATVLSGALEGELESVETAKLVLEVTGHHQADDFAVLARKLDLLKGRLRIAIDDVGTSYSGLRQIVDLKPDVLKLDMALTRDIHRDPARRALTGALVQLARDTGCKLVAEGIETVEERAAMAALGVHYGQGYLFARPLPVIAAQQHLLGRPDSALGPDPAEREERGMPADSGHPELLRSVRS